MSPGGKKQGYMRHHTPQGNKNSEEWWQEGLFSYFCEDLKFIFGVSLGC